ncbi:NADH-quinone oxidoreductase subunit 2 [Aquicella siphonis]|uniref:NADH-quinone oxidoreductase subunit E n=1 Tax=Aquicella siphonis TaxID=254247 RepID=A0A5E4PFK2_9COXI|nr:NAD(P)H-dependent oxidoreductase subunit E [Aquicella siphonis]VVC75213.1 NADH-quinone oxidoreductase subunit 2 [Aquicella siphonis]
MKDNLINGSKPAELSQSTREYLDKWNLRYPPEQKRSGVFEALRVVQEENHGSLTVELMDAVAAYLGMPSIAVYEVATFYSLYHLKPVGRHVIDVCTNISCTLNGAGRIAEHLKKRLGIEFNETSPDGRFTLREVECLGACIAPPVCQIGRQYHENLSPEKIDEILDGLK